MISSRLAKKWQQPYSRTCGYDNIQIAITLMRTKHQCIRGSRVPAHWISVKHLQWEDSTGLKKFRQERLKNPRTVNISRNFTQPLICPGRPKRIKIKQSGHQIAARRTEPTPSDTLHTTDDRCGLPGNYPYLNIYMVIHPSVWRIMH